MKNISALFASHDYTCGEATLSRVRKIYRSLTQFLPKADAWRRYLLNFLVDRLEQFRPLVE
jgi:hypothetical protein